MSYKRKIQLVFIGVFIMTCGFSIDKIGTFKASKSLKEKIDKVLPFVSQQLGVQVVYDQAQITLFEGPEITNVRFIPLDDPALKPIIAIDKITFKPEIDISDLEFKIKEIFVQNLKVDHWRFADKPVGNISFSAGGDFDVDKEKKLTTFNNLHFQIKNFGFTLSGLINNSQKIKIKSKLVIPQTPIQTILDAIPESFIPIVKKSKVEGTLLASINFELDMAQMHNLKIEPQVDIQNYKMLQYSPLADLSLLHHEFLYTALKKNVAVRDFLVGPSNKSFVPFDKLGNTLVKAVITSEDGNFFNHNGFQLEHVKSSLIENIKQKKFVRGASTITMQLIKNLFLHGTKNISRKFEEVLLTYAIEKELDKNRIFELYMNVIEWGPNIYGIGEASRYHFSKSPSQLTASESSFLASIIPNPIRLGEKKINSNKAASQTTHPADSGTAR